MAQTRKLAATATLLLAAVAGAVAAPAESAGGPALLARYEELKQPMALSPFQRPLLLESSASSSAPQGHVYAVVNQPFSKVAPALQSAENWCEILLLHFNVKRCVPARSSLQLVLGKKSEPSAPDAQKLEVSYAVPSVAPGYLAVQMTMVAGPLGTSDYRLSLEAVPLSSTRTFIHMTYSYTAGGAARVATNAYLATLGRDKVGFSVSGRDAAGRPIYVDGVQGVAERNTMRFFLAIEAFLQSLALPPQQQRERRLHAWFAATERYALQLHEMELDEYLAMKRAELNNSTRPLSVGLEMRTFDSSSIRSDQRQRPSGHGNPADGSGRCSAPCLKSCPMSWAKSWAMCVLA